MAFKLVGGFPDNFVYPLGFVTAGTAIYAGSVLAINGNVLEKATATSTIHSIMGVSAEDIDTSASKIKYIPILPGQIWEVGTKNNTHASNQIYESCILNDELSIDNTGTTVTGPTGIFKILDNIGAVSDKKVLGEFMKLSVTST